MVIVGPSVWFVFLLLRKSFASFTLNSYTFAARSRGSRRHPVSSVLITKFQETYTNISFDYRRHSTDPAVISQ